MQTPDKNDDLSAFSPDPKTNQNKEIKNPYENEGISSFNHESKAQNNIVEDGEEEDNIFA